MFRLRDVIVLCSISSAPVYKIPVPRILCPLPPMSGVVARCIILHVPPHCLRVQLEVRMIDSHPCILILLICGRRGLGVQMILDALGAGHIRLVRVRWLRERPAGYRIERRQALEERESKGESPLLSTHEAVELVCRSTRSVGVLTYGW